MFLRSRLSLHPAALNINTEMIQIKLISQNSCSRRHTKQILWSITFCLMKLTPASSQNNSNFFGDMKGRKIFSHRSIFYRNKHLLPWSISSSGTCRFDTSRLLMRTRGGVSNSDQQPNDSADLSRILQPPPLPVDSIRSHESASFVTIPQQVHQDTQPQPPIDSNTKIPPPPPPPSEKKQHLHPSLPAEETFPHLCAEKYRNETKSVCYGDIRPALVSIDDRCIVPPPPLLPPLPFSNRPESSPDNINISMFITSDNCGNADILPPPPPPKHYATNSFQVSPMEGATSTAAIDTRTASLDSDISDTTSLAAVDPSFREHRHQPSLPSDSNTVDAPLLLGDNTTSVGYSPNLENSASVISDVSSSQAIADKDDSIEDRRLETVVESFDDYATEPRDVVYSDNLAKLEDGNKSYSNTQSVFFQRQQLHEQLALMNASLFLLLLVHTIFFQRQQQHEQLLLMNISLLERLLIHLVPSSPPKIFRKVPSLDRDLTDDEFDDLLRRIERKDNAVTDFENIINREDIQSILLCESTTKNKINDHERLTDDSMEKEEDTDGEVEYNDASEDDDLTEEERILLKESNI